MRLFRLWQANLGLSLAVIRALERASDQNRSCAPKSEKSCCTHMGPSDPAVFKGYLFAGQNSRNVCHELYGLHSTVLSRLVLE